MADAQQGHERFRQLQTLAQTQAKGQVSDQTLDAAKQRNALFRELVQRLTSRGAASAQSVGKRREPDPRAFGSKAG